MSDQDEENKQPGLPPGLHKIISGLQKVADQANAYVDQQRRAAGWLPPNETAGARALLRRIYEKTSTVAPGREAETLASINQVLADYLGDQSDV